jgi:hypothetical protein
MQWSSVEVEKPQAWKIVIARCENRRGEITEVEAYWTGQMWRVLGNKDGHKELWVREWAHKAE